VIDPLLPFVRRRGAAVLDGGLATELEARGCDLDDPLWSSRALIENPAIVEAVHTDYLEAGADVITTATYQATIPGLVARGLSKGDARRVLLSGIELALRARDTFWEAGRRDDRDRPSVAASIGSYGAFLADGSEYRGGYGLGMAALAAWHRERRAYVYVRQSTPKQVRENRESQQNQYALVGRAQALGWIPERVHGRVDAPAAALEAVVRPLCPSLEVREDSGAVSFDVRFPDRQAAYRFDRDYVLSRRQVFGQDCF
jgi:hypothetical protein